MAKTLLNADERKRIEEAVFAAEAKTSGEIVPMVVAASDDYPGARWRLATAFAFTAQLIALLLWPELDAWWVAAVFAPGLLVGHALAARPILLRLALSQAKVDEEVQQRAFEAFLQNNLHATRDRTGVLVFVSALERRIQIISDIGIDKATPAGFWQQAVDQLAVRVKAGDLAAGLIETVETCGELLAENFPHQSDDENELPNEVIVEG